MRTRGENRSTAKIQGRNNGFFMVLSVHSPTHVLTHPGMIVAHARMHARKARTHTQRAHARTHAVTQLHTHSRTGTHMHTNTNTHAIPVSHFSTNFETAGSIYALNLAREVVSCLC